MGYRGKISQNFNLYFILHGHEFTDKNVDNVGNDKCYVVLIGAMSQGKCTLNLTDIFLKYLRTTGSGHRKTIG